MPKEKDDSFFVQKSLQGDKDAFGELVRRYQRTVTRTARLWTKSEEDAADIAQETFFRAYRYLNGFKPEKRFINWLLGVTTNTAKSWLKRQRQDVSLEETDFAVLQKRSIEIYSAEMIQRQVHDSITSLSEVNRTVVNLYYICGYSYAEIGQQLGVPQSTVRSRLQEARKQLRKEFVSMVAAFRLQETLTETDGLAGNTVTAIFQDSKENMWFGTTNGVSRYDGKTFVNFTKRDGLATNVVGCIFEDNNANLWFGTGRWNAEGGGASRDDGKTFVNFTKRDGLAGNTVMDIFEDIEGNLWFATRDGGVSRYDGNTFHNITSGFARNADWNHDSFVNAITQDEAGNLWFGCYGGISRYDGHTLHNFVTDDGLMTAWIVDILFDKQGVLWIARAGGGGSGLSRYDGESIKNFPSSNGLPGDIIHSIMQDSKGNMWFGTKDGASVYNGKTFRNYNVKDGLPHKAVSAVLEDRNGTLWFATLGGGVSLGVKSK